MASYEPINALLRGLSILNALNEHGNQGISELARRTGIAKATVVRIIETLQYAGYVTACHDERKYAVTAKVLSLTTGYNQQEHLINIARPLLEEARIQLGWPVELGVHDQDAMVILDTSRQTGAFSINRKPGSRVPLIRTALGRAYLAALPEEELDKLLATLASIPHSDFDLVRKPEKLQAILQQARQLGYASAHRETLANGQALAAAILHQDKPVASVNIVMHASVMPMASFASEFSGKLRELADRISTGL